MLHLQVAKDYVLSIYFQYYRKQNIALTVASNIKFSISNLINILTSQYINSVQYVEQYSNKLKAVVVSKMLAYYSINLIARVNKYLSILFSINNY